MTTTVLFAGGGTGGHIYPNVAIVERLAAHDDLSAHLLVSDRPGDVTILERLDLPYTRSPAKPLPSLRRPSTVWPFVQSLRKASEQLNDLFEREAIAAVVATGGFVSGPAVIAAARRKIPRILVNLDAIPGHANRHLGRLCTKVFSVYPSGYLPQAELIALPLRRASLGEGTPSTAKKRLGLAADRPLLFVTGATHGATSVVDTMRELVQDAAVRQALSPWQVFHQCGTYDCAALQRAYDDAGVRARVVDYCDEMGAAWMAADLAISRSGAGSVAEAWANATPTIFMPNPYHRDQHQRHNAMPLVEHGGAIIVDDLIDAPKNATSMRALFLELLADSRRRNAMKAALEQTRPPDGASTVARWLAEQLPRRRAA